MIVGVKSVTERAYAQSRERRERAVAFVEEAISNGLGRHHLPQAELLELKAQIERDVLVLMMDLAPE